MLEIWNRCLNRQLHTSGHLLKHENWDVNIRASLGKIEISMEMRVDVGSKRINHR